eukprot:scaffold7979_cov149-Skeletonema_menzelii.AAC.3
MKVLLIMLVGSFVGVQSFQLPPSNNIRVFSSSSSSPPLKSNVASAIAVTSDTSSSPVSIFKSKNNDNDADSLLKFSSDVKHVLHNLRAMEFDPCIPKHLMGHHSSSLSYSKTWTLDDWEFHNSRKRYFRYLKNFPHSRLMRRIMPQQLVLLLWTILSVYLEDQFLSTYKPKIPLSALGTISTFVAFLLTLRSNQALSRLMEARALWSKVILNTREMSNLIVSFIYPVDKQLALLLGRHVALFGWLLKSQLRFTKKDDVVELVRTMLPNKRDADYLLSQRQKTVAVITRIRQVLAHLGKAHKLTTAEEIALDHTAHALSEAITSTGRIRASPIPTLYTSHTSRLLVFYLFCLPPALHLSGLDGIMTTILTMVVGFAMFGLDEISHLFEQPFRVIPMYQMSKRAMQATADCFTCRPPALDGEKIVEDEEKELSQRELTSYWSNKDMSQMSDNLME